MKLIHNHKTAAVLMVVVWLAVTAVRSRYAHPYEPLWVIGILASGAAMYASGFLTARSIGKARQRAREGRLR